MQRFGYRQRKKNLPLLVAIFLFLSIPLGVYTLLTIDSTDMRNRAASLDQANNACIISFPFVNSESIEVNKKVQVQVSANFPDESIKNVNIMDKEGTTQFTKEYTNTTGNIEERFTFTKSETGNYGLMGTLVTDKKTYPCVISNNRSVSVVTTNLAPEFKTTSPVSKNSIKVGDNYEYQLVVTDAEKDTINYAFSFTPNASWLKTTIVDNGTDGKLTIKFVGKPDKPASYLANIFVHDGYNQHLRSQSWVISVDQDKNDTPKVTIINPKDDIKVAKGNTVKISWEGADLNVIVSYEIFLATNPGNQNTWVKLDTLNNHYGNYLLDTSKFNEGTYQVIVRATDNYNPPAAGIGVSPKITIGNASDNGGSDDDVKLVDPQIVNISPSSESTVRNKRPNITASLVAGSGAKIKKDTIKVLIDDKDVTSTLKYNEISESEITVMHTPKEDFKDGVHKVSISFEDSKGSKAQRDWTFTVASEVVDTSKINIFGMELDRKLVYIIAGGIGLLLLALIIPWLLYLAWRGSKEDEDYEIQTVYSQTQPIYPTLPERDEREIQVHTEDVTDIQPKEETPTYVFNKVENKEEVKSTEPETTSPSVVETEVKTNEYPFVLPQQETSTPVQEEAKVVEVEKTTEQAQEPKTEPNVIVNNIQIEQPSAPTVVEPVMEKVEEVATPIVAPTQPVSNEANTPTLDTTQSYDNSGDVPPILKTEEQDNTYDYADQTYQELLKLAEDLKEKPEEEQTTTTPSQDTFMNPAPDNSGNNVPTKAE